MSDDRVPVPGPLFNRTVMVGAVVGFLAALSAFCISQFSGWVPPGSLGVFWLLIFPLGVTASGCIVWGVVLWHKGRSRTILRRFRGRVCLACGHDLRTLGARPSALALTRSGGRPVVFDCPACGRRVDLKRQLASVTGAGPDRDVRHHWTFRV